jgi:hypothetical protein
MFTALKGAAKGYPLETSYDNPETREILWANSCVAVGEEFNNFKFMDNYCSTF